MSNAMGPLLGVLPPQLVGQIFIGPSGIVDHDVLSSGVRNLCMTACVDIDVATRTLPIWMDNITPSSYGHLLRLPNLHRLQMHEDISPLGARVLAARCSRLRELVISDLDYCLIDYSEEESYTHRLTNALAQLTSLSYLSVSNVRCSRNIVLSAVGCLTNLQDLSLCDCSVGAPGSKFDISVLR